MAQDPTAADIGPEEAEEFYTAGLALTHLDPSIRAKVLRSFGIVNAPTSEPALRRAILSILRLWRAPRSRETLQFLTRNFGYGKYPGAFGGRAFWSDERFAAAYRDGAPILWLVLIARQLGLVDDLKEWLITLDSRAHLRYWFWVTVARLSLRRVVYPEAAPAAVQARAEAAATVAPVELARSLREKDQETGALRRDVRRLEQDRKRLKRMTRKAELEAKALLPQARGEVAAARRMLGELLAAHEHKLAEQARQIEQEQRLLGQKVAAARDQFLTQFAEATHTSVNLLRGRTVSVSGGAGDPAVHRLLVETLGGHLVESGGEIALSGESGYAALEQDLRAVALTQVLVKCDGLYRNKEGRPGIAVGGFEVYLEGQAVFQEATVVCCGPAAGSLMAEYGALVGALGWLLAAEPAPGATLEVWSDCKALVNRVLGKTRTRRKTGCVQLDDTLLQQLKALSARGCEVRIRWVPRDEVYAVDRLCELTYRHTRWYHGGGKDSAPLKAFLAAVRRPVVKR